MAVKKSEKRSSIAKKILRGIIIGFCCIVLIIIVIVIFNFARNQAEKEKEKKKREFSYENLEGVWKLVEEIKNGKIMYRGWLDRSAGYQIEGIDSNTAIVRYDKNNNNNFDKEEIIIYNIKIEQETWDTGTIQFGSKIWKVELTSSNSLERSIIDKNGNKIKQIFHKVTD